MDKPYEELAQLVGRVLAQRWLERKATLMDVTSADDSEELHRSPSAPANGDSSAAIQEERSAQEPATFHNP